MLGQLKMSTEDALHNYKKLATAVFSPDNRKLFYKDGKFKASTLEAQIKEIVKNSCERYTGDELLLDPDVGKGSFGNVYVDFGYVPILLYSSLSGSSVLKLVPILNLHSDFKHMQGSPIKVQIARSGRLVELQLQLQPFLKLL